jgi:hypothetical protein
MFLYQQDPKYEAHEGVRGARTILEVFADKGLKTEPRRSSAASISPFDMRRTYRTV